MHLGGRRRGTSLLVIVLCGAAGALGMLALLRPAPSGAASRLRVSTAGFPSGRGEPGIFTDRCRFSHEAAADPILMPGQSGRAMHHDFFGNVTTDASSTARTLRGGPTTCTTSADASAYWSPVLYQDGRPLVPVAALIYWRRRAEDHAPVRSVPEGLEMIAGDETASSPQGVNRVAWSCTRPRGGRLVPVRTATPHSCPAGRDLRLTITFPSCWDGHTLSGARQTNVVYLRPRGAGCPSSHPVQIPQIVFHVTYATSSAAGLTLSMSPTMRGSTDTAHADFINGWNETILDRDVRACVATSTRCGPVRGPEATPQGPPPGTADAG